MVMPRRIRILLYVLLITVGFVIPVGVAAENSESSDRSARNESDDGRGKQAEQRLGSRRSYSYKELYGNGKPRPESLDLSYRHKERYRDQNAVPKGREYGQPLSEKELAEKRNSDFKYDADAASDAFGSHRSYRGKGSTYGSGKDRRTFGKRSNR